MNSLLAHTTNPASNNLSRGLLVAAANEAPEPNEELLHPSPSGTPGAAERVAAENFNPNHDDLGRFTFAGGTGGGGMQKPTDGTTPASQTGSGASGGDAGGGGPQNPAPHPPYSPYWGKYGGSSSGDKQGKGTQKSADGTPQKVPVKKPGSSSGAGATGKTTPPPIAPKNGGAVKGPLHGPVDGNLHGPTPRLSQSPTFAGKLSSSPYKTDPRSGQSWAAVAREAIAQVSKLTGKEILRPVPDLEADIRVAHPGSTAVFSDGNFHSTPTAHDLVPVLRKYQIASEDLSSKTREDRSGIEQIGAHLRKGPVLVTVSSGANAHAELIMRQNTDGLYAVYNPSKGTQEDVLHASQIDPRGIIALSAMQPVAVTRP